MQRSGLRTGRIVDGGLDRHRRHTGGPTTGTHRGGPTLATILVPLLVMASVPPARAETSLLEAGASMTYLANTSDPGIDATWFLPGFNEGPEWSEGVYGVGYEGASGGPGATALLETEVAGPVHSIYTRATFSIADIGSVHSLFFGADYDDGTVVWINGVEVYRSPEMRFRPLTWGTSSVSHESSNGLEPEYEPLRDVSAVGLPALQNGVNHLAIGIWNDSAFSEDLVLVPQLLVNKMLRRGPYLQQGTPDSVIVRWRTAVPSDSRVLYGTDPASLTSEVLVGGPVVEHEVALSGLAPSTLYFYAVGTPTEILAGGDSEHAFVTAPAAGVPKPTRIWVVGDSGLGNTSALAVRDAFHAFSADDPTDVWIHVGDVSQIHGTDAQYQTQFFDLYPAMLRTTVLWPAIGNHDQYDDDTQTWPYYDIFTLPQLGEAGGVPSSTEKYYSHDFGNVHFIALNSMEVTTAGFGAAMLAWLEADLQDVTEDWIVAYWHHPPYSRGGHDSDDPADSNGRLVWMRQYALPVLEDYGVDLVLTGHSHSYERSYLLDGHYGYSSSFLESMKKDGGDGNEDGGDGAYVKPYRAEVPYTGEGDGAVYTVAGSSSTLTPGRAEDLGGDDPNHPAMVVSSLTLGSVVLDVNGNRLDSIFLDETGTILDRYTIFKGGPTLPPEADFIVAPRVGQAPVAVHLTDLSLNGPTEWSWDVDGDGTPESSEPGPWIELTTPGLRTVRLVVENSAGVDEETKPDFLCVTSGVPGPVTGLRFETDPGTFSWNAAVNATAYDAVRGDLAALVMGNMATVDLTCLEDDDDDLEASDATPPGSGQALFYLAGAANCAGEQGTYDTDTTGTPTSRDGLVWPVCASCATGADDDGDEVCAPLDNCPGLANPDQQDGDTDGVGDACDGCPSDPDKTEPGLCGCGVADTDSDGDETPDCDDLCPSDPDKVEPGLCGCGVADTDSDGDLTPDCLDGCPFDPGKVDPGICGCGVADTDSDGDLTPDCLDGCPFDPNKVDPGICGCGLSDRDDDQDGTPNCIDGCPLDPNKVDPGICGCGIPDSDSDSDGALDCDDLCPFDPEKVLPGQCGCGVSACWVAQSSGTSRDLESVDFPTNALTGFIVGAEGTFLRTDTGGFNWVSGSAGTNANLSSVTFVADAATGYIVGDEGTILKSSTGGAFWSPLGSGTFADLNDVEFLGESGTGYVVGAAGTLLKTIDDGSTWTALDSRTEEDLESVHFPTGTQVGYVVGSKGTILATANGGNSWDVLDSSTEQDLADVYFPFDNLWGYVAGSAGTLLLTTDGGLTWSPEDALTSNDLRAIQFPRGAPVGYVVGERGVIRRTDDGGQTWVPEESLTVHGLRALHFHGGRTGFAVGRNGVIRKRVED